MSDERRLESWKEIGAYLQKDLRTARRWEKEEGLPVHRHSHKSRASVYAYPGEIDAWRASRKAVAEPPPPLPLWRTLLAPPRSLAFGVTLALCLLMAGNGIRPQTASAQDSGKAMQMRQRGTLPVQGQIFGPVSSDGRYVAYVGWRQKGNLFVHDLISGTDRPLTDTASDGSGENEEYAEETAFSRDGKQLAYSWEVGRNDRYELRLVPLGGSGVPTPRRVFDNPDVAWIAPTDWSPDGHWIAVNLSRKDGTGQIGVVSAADGALRVLKSTPWNGLPGQMYFSPDGKYLAYALRDPGPVPQQDLYVLAVDGSREFPAVVHQGLNLIVGWSPDGRLLLYSSDRGGDNSLWAQPIVEGKPSGSPRLLNPDLGGKEAFGVTVDGVLYLSELQARTSLQIVETDPMTGRFLSSPQPALPGSAGSVMLPAWSPDNARIAYGVRRGSPSAPSWAIGMRNIETGETREMPTTPGLDQLRTLCWAPDGASFVVTGRDLKAGQGVFRVDARTGATTQVASGMNYRSVAFAPDGKSLYMLKGPQPWTYVRWDPASGTETRLFQSNILGAVHLSPDGRYLATPGVDEASNSRTLLLIPTAGGEPRELMRIASGVDTKQVANFAVGQGLGVLDWAPDSKALYVRKLLAMDGQQDDEMWRVPVDESAPNLVGKIGREMGSGGFHINSSGRRIVFQVTIPWQPTRIWALENFLPEAAATAK